MMKRIFFLGLMLTIAFNLPAQYETKNFIDQPYIEVQGKAEMEIVPDMIFLKVIIDEKDNKAKISLEQKEKRMMETLSRIGVDTKNEVSVLDYTSNFKEHWIRKSNILTSKEYEIVVHNGKMVAMVFLELEKLEISNITINKLDHSKLTEYRQQVKIEAVKAAKNKAKSMLSAIDEQIGKTLYIQEINRNVYTRMNSREANTLMKVKSVSSASDEYIPDVEFQKITLDYEILARFAIQ